MVLSLFKKAAKTPAGLDISSDGFILACISEEKGRSCLKNLYSHNFNEEILQNGMITKPELFAESLRKIIEENNLNLKKVNLSVSSSNMFIKTVSFPDLPEEEIRVIAPQEASKHISQTVNQINVDFELLEDTKKDNKVDVILCALSKDISKNLADSVAMAGLEINALEASSFSMIRTLANAEKINNPDFVYVCVLMEDENTDISIIKKGMPVFSNHVQIGKKHIVESFMKGFEIAYEEANNRLPYFGLLLPGSEGSSDPDFNKASNLMRPHYSNISAEIQKTIEFYNSQSEENIGIEKIILGGRGVCIQNVDKYISNKLKIQTELCNSLENIVCNPDTAQKFPANIPVLAVSVGLALYPA